MDNTRFCCFYLVSLKALQKTASTNLVSWWVLETKSEPRQHISELLLLKAFNVTGPVTT
jgi:hypothetical protein